MKKIYFILVLIVVAVVAYFINLNYTMSAEPNTYYKVYLDGEEIGIVESKKKLEDYIDKQNNKYKEKYGVTRVYSPNGLDIEKVVTYASKVKSVKDIYNLIQDKKPFTISGYQFKIVNSIDSDGNKTNEKDIKLYAINKEIFNEAIENLYATYLGKDLYTKYIEEKQETITTTGTYIDNVYIGNEITIKKVKIPVTKQIYSDASGLSQYLLFGDSKEKRTYVVQDGDTIDSVTFANKISAEEFLLSNPSFNDKSNLLYKGQQVFIKEADPKIEVVVEKSVVEDVTKNYETIIRYDSNKVKGDNEIIQQGSVGLERVSQKVKSVNGAITVIKPVSKEELKASVSKIVIYGEKEVPNVGATGSWYWPTNSGYTITSPYGYRWGKMHWGVDISGTGCGSNLYATNNGTVVSAGYRYDYGNYVIINHNNGFSSLYGHMSRIASSTKVGVTVSRGQLIGYMGNTGDSYGCHLHIEIWRGLPFTGQRQNPMNYL